jgi:hypothetical protein
MIEAGRLQAELSPQPSLDGARASDRVKDQLHTIEDLLEAKSAGYSPNTETSRIVFELNNPPSVLVQPDLEDPPR